MSTPTIIVATEGTVMLYRTVTHVVGNVSDMIVLATSSIISLGESDPIYFIQTHYPTSVGPALLTGHCDIRHVGDVIHRHLSHIRQMLSLSKRIPLCRHSITVVRMLRG